MPTPPSVGRDMVAVLFYCIRCNRNDCTKRRQWLFDLFPTRLLQLLLLVGKRVDEYDAALVDGR